MRFISRSDRIPRQLPSRWRYMLWNKIIIKKRSFDNVLSAHKTKLILHQQTEEPLTMIFVCYQIRSLIWRTCKQVTVKSNIFRDTWHLFEKHFVYIPARYLIVSSLSDSRRVFKEATCMSIFFEVSTASLSISAFWEKKKRTWL